MGNLEGSSGYCTWLLTLKLLGPIWAHLGEAQGFQFCHLALGRRWGRGCCAPSLRPDFGAHLGLLSKTCFFPFLLVSWRPPSVLEQKL